jgi:protein subunit release factor A
MPTRVILGCAAVHPDQRGGQHVAMSCTGVLIIDEELGLGVMCNANRSQFGNKAGAEEALEHLRKIYGRR